MKKYFVIASVALNAFAILELWCFTDFIKDCTVVSTDSTTVLCPCSSIDTYRYRDETEGGGAQISREEAQNYLNRFHETYPGCTMSGAFISKHALDDLFCQDSTWNGVYCYMGIRDDDTYTMIIEGNHLANSAIRRSDGVPSQFYISESICPDWCGAIAPH